MVSPQTRKPDAAPEAPPPAAEAAPVRVDPEYRPIDGIPTTDIEVTNKDPGRCYLLVAKMGVGYITPDYYEAIGWRVERWASFEGIQDPEQRQTAERTALRFVGTRLGRPGEPIERMDCLLMSIEKEAHEAFYKAQQKRLDPIEQQIVDPTTALNAARQGIRQLGRKAQGIGASLWDPSMEGA
jgi:hypothetical protein